MDEIVYVEKTLNIIYVYAYMAVIFIGALYIFIILINSKIKLSNSQKELDNALNRYSQEDIMKMFPETEGYIPKKLKSIIITVEYEDNSLQDIMKEPITVVADRIPLSTMAKAMIDIRDKIIKESKQNDAI